jgi:hypothetical protein
MKSSFFRTLFTRIQIPFLFFMFCVSCTTYTPSSPYCPPVPDDIVSSDLVGIWTATDRIGQSLKDTLIIREDGKYKQLIDIESDDGLPVHVETDWQAWAFEVNDTGIGYLHLVGLDVCTRLGETACEWHSYSSFNSDYCMGDVIEHFPGEQVLIVAGFPIYDAKTPTPVRDKQFALSLSMGFESSPWRYYFEGPIR